jgi:hypothetical protein
LLSIGILILAFVNVVAGVVWPGEIPPGWELEWVDDDE